MWMLVCGCGDVVLVKNSLLPHALIIFRSPTQVTPSRYGRQYPVSIPHPIILSNIIGRRGGTFHLKLEHQFAISWGLFCFHTSQNFTHPPTYSPPTNSITTPFIRGGKVFITPLRNTSYNYLPLSNNHIVSYIYTNYYQPPTTINHNHPFTYKYHTLTIKPPKNNRTLYRKTY